MTLTWHLATNHIISSHVTSQPTTLFHLTPQPTTSKQVTTSPPWNGWRLVHTKNSVWASHWLAAFARILWAKTSAQLARLYLHILNETPASCALNMRGPCGPCVLFFLSCTAEDSTSFFSPGLKIVEQKLQIPHANWNFDASSHQPSDAFSDPGPLPQKSCAMTPWTKYP